MTGFWCLTGHLHPGAPATIEERQAEVDAIFAELWPPRPRPSHRAIRGNIPTTSLLDRLIADCAEAADGERSEKDFRLCCEARRRGWDREFVWQRAADIGKFAERGRRYFDMTWQKAETAIADGGALVEADGLAAGDSSSSPITNLSTDGIPLPMAHVLAEINAATDGWPRRIDQALFVPDGLGVSWLDSDAATFGWLNSLTGTIHWSKKMGCVSKAEVVDELVRTAQRCLAIEELPHYPGAGRPSIIVVRSLRRAMARP